MKPNISAKLIARSSMMMTLCVIAGCAGLNRAMEYGSSPVIQQKMADDTYRIFDKPAEGRLMITPSIGASMARGAVTGGTFGVVQPNINLPAYEAAALAYFRAAGRDCTITSRDEIIKPQWEFKYSCKKGA